MSRSHAAGTARLLIAVVLGAHTACEESGSVAGPPAPLLLTLTPLPSTTPVPSLTLTPPVAPPTPTTPVPPLPSTPPALTPTPPPASLTGSWSGTFWSSDPAQCGQMAVGVGSATLRESGNSVDGTIRWEGGQCELVAQVALARSGDQLQGTAVFKKGVTAFQLWTSSVTGSFTASELRLNLTVFAGLGGTEPGGLLLLQRQ